jgi:RimJ/RimL family protein N-acetyltransferase
MNRVLIRTRRLRIRPFVESDLAAMLRVFTDPEVMRFVPGGAHDEARSAERLQSLIRHHRDHGVGKWAVQIAATNEVIGDCGLQFLDSTNDLEIGFHFAREHWGKRFATEAAQACLARARTARTERIVAIVDPEHAASRRVLVRIGLRYASEAQHFGRSWSFYVDPKTPNPVG